VVGVPTVAGVVTTAVLVGPGRTRPVDAARVYGVVEPGTEQVALQIRVVRFDGDLITPAPPRQLEAFLEGAASGRWTGRIDPAAEEAAEAVVPLDQPWAGGSATLTVSDGAGTLARNELVPRDQSAPPVPPVPVVQGLSISLARGGAVPELPEPLTVSLVTPTTEAAPALEMAIDGGDLDETPSPERECDDLRCRWFWKLDVVSRATSTLVKATATLDEERFHHEQWLPLRPGALWLAPDATSVRAASPRENAFVAVHGSHGRVWSRRLSMAVDARGFASAPLSLPTLPPGPAVVTLASEAGPARDRRTSWPLPGHPEIVAPSMTLLADGLPAARERERTRQEHARIPAFALVVAAALFEVAFLYWQRRRSQLDLARRMREAHIDPETVTSRPAAWWLVVLTGALLLAFLALAALALFGTQLPLEP